MEYAQSAMKSIVFLWDKEAVRWAHRPAIQ